MLYRFSNQGKPVHKRRRILPGDKANSAGTPISGLKNTVSRELEKQLNYY